jgi:hypothetical protein
MKPKVPPVVLPKSGRLAVPLKSKAAVAITKLKVDKNEWDDF